MGFKLAVEFFAQLLIEKLQSLKGIYHSKSDDAVGEGLTYTFSWPQPQVSAFNPVIVIPLQAGIGKILVIETVLGSVKGGNEVVESVAANAIINSTEKVFSHFVYNEVFAGMIIRYECTVYFYDRKRQR
jgi:hypothetical protein